MSRGDAAPARPILQGDVFAGVTVPNVGVDHQHAMIIAHPCTMRQGADLKPRIKMIPVTPYEHVPWDRWDRVVRFFPLPDVLGDGADYAARFDEIGMVSNDELLVTRRVSTLTERGILILQQRYVFSDTRAELDLTTLEAASAAVLIEAELLEEWNERLALSGDPEGHALIEALAAQAYEFDAYLGSAGDDGLTRRELLNDQSRHASVRRAVREEIGRRLPEGNA